MNDGIAQCFANRLQRSCRYTSPIVEPRAMLRFANAMIVRATSRAFVKDSLTSGRRDSGASQYGFALSGMFTPKPPK